MKNEVLKTLLVILAGPVLVLSLAWFGIVLAPPNQGFSTLVYLPLCGMQVLISIVLLIRKRIMGWKLWAFAMASIFVPICLFMITASAMSLPGGMSTCTLVESTNLKVRYECVDFSSDDATYHREFSIVGLKGWPVMRVINK